MKKKGKYFCKILLFFGLILFHQVKAQTWQWVNSPSTSKFEAGNAVCIDTINQFFYVGGVISGAPAEFPQILSSEMNGASDNGKKDGFLAKYDFDGNLIWSFNIGGTDDDEITGITVDPSGKIYVTGYIKGSASLSGHIAGNPGSTNASFGNQDAFLASYLPTGSLQGFHIFGGAGNDQGIDICSNNSFVYALGFFENFANIGGINTMTPYNKKNIYLFAMDFSGGSQWMFDCGSDGDDYDTGKTFQQKNMGVTCDEDNAYIIGMMKGSNMFMYNADGSQDGPLMNEDINEDIFILSIDNNGFYNWGQLLINIQNSVVGMDIAQDCEGLYITAVVHDFTKFPSGAVISSDHDDCIFAQLDKTTGIDNWIVQITGTDNENDIGFGIETDKYGGVYVTGTYKSDPVSFGSDITFSGIDGTDAFVAKYTNDGVYEWVINQTGSTNGKALDVACYRNTEVFVCGQFDDDMFFNPFTISESTDNNIFFGKLSVPPVGFPSGVDAFFEYPETDYCQSHSNPIPSIINTTGGSFSESSGNITFVDALTGEIDLLLSTPGGPYIISYTTPSPCKSISEFEIFISPDLPPSIICPSNISVSNDVGVCGAVVSYALPTGFDDCTVYPTISQSDVSGLTSDDFFPVGSTIQTYEIKDTSGQTSTCSFAITVNDVEPPDITCPTNQSRNTNAGVCTYTVLGTEFDLVSSFDNCAIASITNNYNGLATLDGEVLDAGTYFITWTAIDIYNNISTCSFELEIAVLDVNATIVDCGSSYFGESTIGNGNNGNNFTCAPVSTPGEDNYYQITVPAGNYQIMVTMNNASDPNDGEAYIFWVGSSCPVGTSCISDTYYDIANQEFENGSNQMLYMAPGPGTYYLVIDSENDGINSYDISFDCLESGIEFDQSGGCVADLDNDGVVPEVNSSPVLQMEQCQSVKICHDLYIANILDYEWMDSVFMSLGDCYQNITNITPNGSATGFYQAGNWIGNYSAGDNTIAWEFFHNAPNTSYGDGYEGEYSCAAGETHFYTFCFDAEIKNSCISNSELNISITISDDGVGGSGGTASSIDVVLIDDYFLSDPSPIFSSCPSDVILVNDPGNCGAIASWLEPTVLDNCPLAPTQTTGLANGSLFPIGNTLIEYEAVDISGNTATCSFNVIVSDNEAPLISCSSNQLVSANAGTCEYTVVGTAFNPTSYSDNCGTVSIVNDYNTSNTLNGAVFPLGTTTLTWTGTDLYGNSSNCQFDITVTDNINPSISCPASTNLTTDFGTCTHSISGSELFPTSISDNCSVASIINDYNSSSTLAGEYLPEGTTSIQWQVWDSEGNTSTCSFNVNITDNQSPIMSCSGDQTFNADPGLCSYSVIATALDPSSVSDNCGIASITNDLNGSASLNGFIFLEGVNTVTWTILDNGGNSTTCTAEITVNDNQNPIISCPPNQLLSSSPAQCSYLTGTELDPTGLSDNCGILSLENDINLGPSLSGESFAIGATSVLWTITDINGLIQTCSFNILVEDNEAPLISCPSDQTVYCDTGVCSHTVLGTVLDPVSFSDNCTGFSIANNLNGLSSLDTYPLNEGLTNIIWTISDASGNVNTCELNVTTIDNQLPNILCPNDTTVNMDNGLCYFSVADTLFQPVSFSDNCVVNYYTNSINSTSNLIGETFAYGTHNIVWEIIDVTGNLNSCSFNINVEDNELPEISCPVNQTRTASSGCSYTVSGTELDPISFSDNCSGEIISNNINGLNSLSGEIFNTGITTITWTVNDAQGNSNDCTFELLVQDESPPFISCVPNQIVSTDTGTCSFIINDSSFDPDSISDNCGLFTFHNSLNSDITLAGTTLDLGIHSIYWYVFDNSGNTDSCMFSLEVTDNELPTITCVSDTILNNSLGTCSHLIEDLGLNPISMNDNCGISTFSNDFNSTTSLLDEDFPVGITLVNWIVVDGSGNSNSCSTNITVNDLESPIIECPPNIVSCDSTIFWTNPTYSDNCSGVVIFQSDISGLSSGSIFPIGITTIEYTASDVAVNQSTCSFDVDILPPLMPDWDLLPGSVCSNHEPINLSDLVNGTPGGEWQIDGNTVSNFNPSDLAYGIHAVNYILTNGVCIADSTQHIEILLSPYAEAGENQEVCGNITILEGYAENGLAYWKTTGSVEYTPDTIGLAPTISDTVYGSHYLTFIVDQSGVCFDFDSVEIILYENPTIINAGADISSTLSKEIILDASIPDVGTGKWSFVAGWGIISNEYDPKAVISNIEGISLIIRWEVTNGTCMGFDDLVITWNPFDIPDAFSPNSDGYNDFFVIKGIDDYQNEITVFNRWGIEVFNQKNYQNNWAGTNKNNKDLPDDTYFYIFIIEGVTYNGSIMINR